MDRRLFLTNMGCLATAAMSAPLLAAPQKQRWGMHSSTIVSALEQDFEGTFKALARIGYREIETYGSFGRDPAYVREVFDRCGLTAPSHHIASDELYASFRRFTSGEISKEENRANYARVLEPKNSLVLVEQAIDKAKRMGQSHLVWVILLPSMYADRDILNQYVEVFRKAGAMCRDAGLVFAYHNHKEEFRPMPGDTISAYDIMMRETDPGQVKLEMDLYWVLAAGKDPVAYLRANPGRYVSCHLKDLDEAGRYVPLGSGTLKLPELINAARQHGIKHFYAEFDRAPDPMKFAADSYAYLDKLKLT